MTTVLHSPSAAPFSWETFERQYRAATAADAQLEKNGQEEEGHENAAAAARLVAQRIHLHKRLPDTINVLRAQWQPAQRTQEWHQYRWTMITASNAYKAFESDAARNALIFEKCKPMEIVEEGVEPVAPIVNANGAAHWGNKYEPVSVSFYEYIAGGKVEDFGCLRHPRYPFLGASPDGIVTDLRSPRYGRMLEIKNPVSRVLTGTPKNDYWVQMQMQMEVCDLHLCDFLETKIVEYTDQCAFAADAHPTDFGLTADGKWRGMIVHMVDRHKNPHYFYPPRTVDSDEALRQWRDQTLQPYQQQQQQEQPSSAEHQLQFLTCRYWKMDHYSLVTVERDRAWFANAVDTLREVWDTIEHERQHGFDHRAPNRRGPRKNNKNGTQVPKCLLLHINKLPAAGAAWTVSTDMSATASTAQQDTTTIQTDNNNTQIESDEDGSGCMGETETGHLERNVVGDNHAADSEMEEEDVDGTMGENMEAEAEEGEEEDM